MTKCLASIWLDDTHLQSVCFEVDSKDFWCTNRGIRAFTITLDDKTYKRDALNAGEAVHQLIWEIEGK